MSKKRSYFWNKNIQHGGMLIELMMSIAIAAIIIPFVFKYQQNAVDRARNISVTKQIEEVQNALERYIIDNKGMLMKPMGKKIYRVQLQDLVDYGLSENISNNYEDDYQLRVLKSADKDNKSTLQGVVILANNDITPVRTREIVNLGGGNIGFVDGNTTYGGFGVFRANAVDFGMYDTNGIIGLTNITNGNTEYLWRLPSNKESDSTMLSDLNLDAHDIKDISYLDSYKMQLEEKLKTGDLSVDTLTFANRTTISSDYSTKTALVSGALTSDSKELSVNDKLSLADTAKFSSFYTNDFYVNTMTLGGMSVGYDTVDDDISKLKIIGKMDLVLGHIEAENVVIGYTGSVTPRLVVNNKIQDTTDSSFYWDVNNNKANFADISFPELSRMATLIVAQEAYSGTSSASIFGSVAANTNATVGDFLNAINSIQLKVREKYQMLNLE